MLPLGNSKVPPTCNTCRLCTVLSKSSYGVGPHNYWLVGWAMQMSCQFCFKALYYNAFLTYYCHCDFILALAMSQIGPLAIFLTKTIMYATLLSI